MKGSIKEVLKFLHTLMKKDGDQSGSFCYGSLCLQSGYRSSDCRGSQGIDSRSVLLHVNISQS